VQFLAVRLHSLNPKRSRSTARCQLVRSPTVPKNHASRSIIRNSLRIIGAVSPQKKESGRWGFRPLVGIGVMEVQTFEALGGGLEYTNRVPAGFGSVDRPEGSIGPGTKVLRARFAAFSLRLNGAAQSDRLAGAAACLPVRARHQEPAEGLDRNGNQTRTHSGRGNSGHGHGTSAPD
jgi:hypothetical protein